MCVEQVSNIMNTMRRSKLSEPTARNCQETSPSRRIVSISSPVLRIKTKYLVTLGLLIVATSLAHGAKVAPSRRDKWAFRAAKENFARKRAYTAPKAQPKQIVARPVHGTHIPQILNRRRRRVHPRNFAQGHAYHAQGQQWPQGGTAMRHRDTGYGAVIRSADDVTPDPPTDKRTCVTPEHHDYEVHDHNRKAHRQNVRKIGLAKSKRARKRKAFTNKNPVWKTITKYKGEDGRVLSLVESQEVLRTLCNSNMSKVNNPLASPKLPLSFGEIQAVHYYPIEKCELSYVIRRHKLAYA